MRTNFNDDNHALHTGMALGVLMKQGLDVQPETDRDGDYTDVIALTDNESEIVFRLKVLPQESR